MPSEDSRVPGRVRSEVPHGFVPSGDLAESPFVGSFRPVLGRHSQGHWVQFYVISSTCVTDMSPENLLLTSCASKTIKHLWGAAESLRPSVLKIHSAENTVATGKGEDSKGFVLAFCRR